MVSRRFAKWFCGMLLIGCLSGLMKLSLAAEPITAKIRELRFEQIPGELLLSAPHDRRQLLVTGIDATGAEVDLTREVIWESSPPKRVAIDSQGVLTPLQNGTVQLKASLPKKFGRAVASKEVSVRVEGLSTGRSVSFFHEIVPTLTRLDCNGGGCHGKADGQNGFRLSLFGFEAADDYERLVKEGRGRRLNFAAPEASLLLQKAIGNIPHGGGKRLETHSFHYELLEQWLHQGCPESPRSEPSLAQLSVIPAQRTVAPGRSQQLAVVATFSDGSTRDVTNLVRFTANHPDLATVSPEGLVSVAEGAGIATVMIRYEDQAAVFRAVVPLGAEVAELPEEKNFIDTHLIRQWKMLGLPPSADCTDAEFIRRVSIDLLGRLPTRLETEHFVADTDPQKDQTLIDKHLASKEYAEYFAAKWSAILRNRRQSEKDDRKPTEAFHAWIVASLHENKPFTQFVREIITAEGEAVASPPAIWYREVNEVNEQLEDTAQLFLGQRIACARCHHHPLEKWSQTDYYRLSAFFTRLDVIEAKPEKKSKDKETKKEIVTPGTPFRVVLKKGKAEAAHPKTNEKLLPAGLGAVPLKIAEEHDPRQALVDWMVAPENPYFSRMLANRYWKHFFGRGLVEPEDDLRVTNPASNPELLDALAAKIRECNYDLKALVRLLCSSNAYRRSADANQHNGIDQQSFSRFYPRRLQAEVLLDAIDAVTSSSTKHPGGADRAVALSDNISASYFLGVFGRPDAASACECERSGDVSLAQCLHLLNSKEIMGKVSGGRAANLAKDKRTHAEKIRELYLVAFSREPKPTETEALTTFIEERKDAAAAYADLTWVLLNSKEFLFNH